MVRLAAAGCSGSGEGRQTPPAHHSPSARRGFTHRLWHPNREALIWERLLGRQRLEQEGTGRGCGCLSCPIGPHRFFTTPSLVAWFAVGEATPGSSLSEATFASCFVLGGEEGASLLWSGVDRLCQGPLHLPGLEPGPCPGGPRQPGAPSILPRKSSQNPCPGGRIKPLHL